MDVVLSAYGPMDRMWLQPTDTILARHQEGQRWPATSGAINPDRRGWAPGRSIRSPRWCHPRGCDRGALLSGGTSILSQKSQRGAVDWKSAGVNAIAGGLTGAVTGGLGMWGREALAGARAGQAARAVTVNAGVNGTVGAGSSVASYLLGNGGRVGNGWQFAGAIIGGGVSGAAGGLAGPAGSTLAAGAGQATTGLLAKASTASLSGIASSVATVADDVVSGREVNVGATGLSAATGMVSSFVPGPSMKGVTTLRQLSVAAPRTPMGAINVGKINTRALWGSSLIGAGVGIVNSQVNPLS